MTMNNLNMLSRTRNLPIHNYHQRRDDPAITKRICSRLLTMPMAIALFAVLSLNNIMIALRDNTRRDDPLSFSLAAFLNSPTAQSIREGARVVTIDEIINLQENANKGVPKLRKKESNGWYNAKTLATIKNEFEHDSNDSDSNDENSKETSDDSRQHKNKNKFMLLHVGPPATGAQRIQKDSALDRGLREALRKDGVLYVGNYAEQQTKNDFVNSKICSQKFVQTKLELAFMENSFEFREMPITNDLSAPDKVCTSSKCLMDCWVGREHQKYEKRKKGREITTTTTTTNVLEFDGIIQSNEKESWNDKTPFHQRFNYKEFGFWKDYLGHNEIIAVAAYRRYYSWILEVYNEMTLEHCLPEPKPNHLQRLLVDEHGTDRGEIDEMTILWRYQNDIRKKSLWPDDGGFHCPNLWDFVKSHLERTEKDNKYGARVFDNIDVTVPVMKNALKITGDNPYGRVEILNYYQDPTAYNSITTELYCGVLGMRRTPHACAYAMANLDRGPPSMVNRKVHYDMIVVAAHQKGWIGTSPEADDLAIIDFDPDDIPQYNDPNQSRYNPEIVPKQTQRIRLRNELIEYHTRQLRKTILDLPLICPPKEELKNLLDRSIEFEELVMPELAKDKKNHVNEFWRSHESEKTFCWVDTERLFEGANSWSDVRKKALKKSWAADNSAAGQKR